MRVAWGRRTLAIALGMFITGLYLQRNRNLVFFVFDKPRRPVEEAVLHPASPSHGARQRDGELVNLASSEGSQHGAGCRTGRGAGSGDHGNVMYGSIHVAAWLTVLLAVVPVCAVGSTFYVHPQGSDRAAGSPTQPWRTIGHAASVAQPGDAVVVNPGTYRESIILPRSGAPAARIVFQGLAGAVLASPDPSASLSAFDIGANAYITVQGFEMTGGFDETVFLRPGAHDVELSDLHIHGNHTGIWIAGAWNVTVSDSMIAHNYRTGIRIFAGAHHVRVIDTHSEANDDGLGCEGASDGFNADDSTSDVTFDGASAIGNSQDGIDLRGSSMTLRRVTLRGNACTGIKLAAGGHVENALVGSSAVGVAVGVGVTSPPGATTVLRNCTVSQNDLGLRLLGSGHTVAVHNSIISGPAKAVEYAASVQLQEDHNVLHRPSSTERIIVRQEADGSETRYSGDDVNGGKWQSESGQGGATLFASPNIQPLSGELLPGSPAIDSGADAASPSVDLVGTPRPVGVAVDRGAWEWDPARPTLRLVKTTLRTTGANAGAIKMSATLAAPANAAFDPSVDSVSVTVDGGSGRLFRIDVPPTGWRRSPVPSTALLRLRRNESSTSLTIRRSPGMVSLRLRAPKTSLSGLTRQEISVGVALGDVQAHTVVALRAVGPLLRFP